MNQWSKRRKRIILSLLIFVLVFLIGTPLFFLLYSAPSCNDLIQNGDEEGVDCGGSCQLLCTISSLPLITKGDPRVLEVSDNVFEIVALVENPNTNGEIPRARYILKLYDATSIIPLKVVEGEVYVPKGSTFPIFEGPFTLEEGANPIRATLEWVEESLVWQRNTLMTPVLVVQDLNLSRDDSSPRLDAIVENGSLEDVSNINFTALILNEAGNIIAVSRTFVDKLPAGERAPIIFTWPKPFKDTASSFNIMIQILPDKSFIR